MRKLRKLEKYVYTGHDQIREKKTSMRVTQKIKKCSNKHLSLTV